MAVQCNTIEDLATNNILNNYVWCQSCEQKGSYKVIPGRGIKTKIVIDTTKNHLIGPFPPYNPIVINNDPNCFFKIAHTNMLKTHLTNTNCEPTMQNYYKRKNQQTVADKKPSFEPSKTKNWPQFLQQMTNADFDVITEMITEILGKDKEKYNMEESKQY